LTRRPGPMVETAAVSLTTSERHSTADGARVYVQRQNQPNKSRGAKTKAYLHIAAA
jgi:hypothetical protein